MRFLYPLFSLFFILNNLDAGAQITLNPAVDTANNSANREVIKTLVNYLNARFEQKDAKLYWLPGEAARLKAYDLYEAHSLYRINFDDKIILGITQPAKGLYKVKVLFDYVGTDKVRTIFSINDYYLAKQNGSYKLTNALYNNMRLSDYKTINTAKINYHFPLYYRYQQLKTDSANRFLQAIEHYFNKPLPGKIEYITASSCESVYRILGAEYQVGTLSSTTTSCGYFDAENQLIITSGDEFYKHELLRTLNILYPHAPDLLLSGITTLWGGTANKAAIYHLKKLYPYILKHPEVLDKIDDFYYYDDETNPSFIFEAIVVNYILKHDGKAVLLNLMDNLKTGVTIAEFLKDHYNITSTRAFFLKEFDYYYTRSSFENDDLFKLETHF